MNLLCLLRMHINILNYLDIKFYLFILYILCYKVMFAKEVIECYVYR